jgi:hypothetical protein
MAPGKAQRLRTPEETALVMRSFESWTIGRPRVEWSAAGLTFAAAHLSALDTVTKPESKFVTRVGRPTIGDRPMTAVERQQRRRASNTTCDRRWAPSICDAFARAIRSPGTRVPLFNPRHIGATPAASKPQKVVNMHPPNTRPGASPPAIMTVGEASKWSGLHGSHLRTALSKREIPTREVEGRTFILRADLAAWLDGKGFKMLAGAQ